MLKRTLLHLTCNRVLHASRIYRESAYLLQHSIFDDVVALGFAEANDELEEQHASGLVIQRWFSLRSRWASSVSNWPTLLRKLVSFFSLMCFHIWIALRIIAIRPSAISCHHVSLLPTSVCVAFLLRIRFVYNPHELESKKTGLTAFQNQINALTERLFLRFVNDMIVVCEPIRQWYAVRFPWIQIVVVRSIPEWRSDNLEGDIFRTRTRTELSLAPDKLVFSYNGILAPERGTDLLIEKFQDCSSAQLLLIGFGPSFESAMAACEMSSTIKVLSAVPSEQLYFYNYTCDVGLIVFPDPVSLSYSFSLPNKFFEYINAGIPVVVSSNLVYLSDLVSREQVGWVVDLPIDVSRLVQVIEADLSRVRDRVADYKLRNSYSLDAVAFSRVYSS